MSEGAPPIGPASMDFRHGSAALSNLRRFRCIDGRMFRGLISKPSIPDDAPANSRNSKKKKNKSPLQPSAQDGCQHWCESARQMCPAKEKPLNPSAFTQ